MRRDPGGPRQLRPWPSLRVWPGATGLPTPAHGDCGATPTSPAAAGPRTQTHSQARAQTLPVRHRGCRGLAGGERPRVRPAARPAPQITSPTPACPRSRVTVAALSPASVPFPSAFYTLSGAFKLNSQSKFQWQSVPGDTSASICCLSPLEATYTGANSIRSRS